MTEGSWHGLLQGLDQHDHASALCAAAPSYKGDQQATLAELPHAGLAEISKGLACIESGPPCLPVTPQRLSDWHAHAWLPGTMQINREP